jgi:hypothetical protein
MYPALLTLIVPRPQPAFHRNHTDIADPNSLFRSRLADGLVPRWPAAEDHVCRRLQSRFACRLEEELSLIRCGTLANIPRCRTTPTRSLHCDRCREPLTCVLLNFATDALRWAGVSAIAGVQPARFARNWHTPESPRRRDMGTTAGPPVSLTIWVGETLARLYEEGVPVCPVCMSA